jgi:hypothetical protein
LVTNPPGTKDGRHWIIEVQNWTGWVPAASSEIHLTRIAAVEALSICPKAGGIRYRVALYERKWPSRPRQKKVRKKARRRKS